MVSGTDSEMPFPMMSASQVSAWARIGKRLLLVVSLVLVTLTTGCGRTQKATELTIATVNNADMFTMKELSKQFESENPGVRLNWVMLDENVLRQRITTDVAMGGGQFDVVTIGSYEVPIWGTKGWLEPIQNLPADYDIGDLLKPVREGLSRDGKLYALPFYGESSITYYRKDLFAEKHLVMPAQPTYAEIESFARELTDKSKGQYGICLRGQAGWGANMALIDTMVNAYGGRWFDTQWNATIDSPQWNAAVNEYVKLLTHYGPPGATSNNFNENLALFAGGSCAMWIDATVAAGILTNPNESVVWNNVGFASAPMSVTAKGSHWLWVWSLGVPTLSKNKAVAMRFIEWATSKNYIAMVGDKKGWASATPGTRYSTYANAKYRQAAPFGEVVLNAIETTDSNSPTLDPVPYTGIQFVAIPEFQSVGTQVGQIMSDVVAGNRSTASALAFAQLAANRAARQGGYQH
jgi:sorbitol/mannitol transport system substrate-binding protein